MSLRRARLPLALVLCSRLAACVLPIPIEPRELPSSRSNIGDTPPAFLVAGRTTRADVLLELGEPDQESEHEQFLTYIRVSTEGGVLLLAGAGGQGGAIRSESLLYRFLTIRFDERGVVADARGEQTRCRQAQSGMDSSLSKLGPCAYPPGQAGVLARFGYVFAPSQWVHGKTSLEWRRALGLESAAPRGALVVKDVGIAFFAENADADSKPILSAAYADMTALSLHSTAAGQRLVLTMRDGTEESFSVLHGDRVDAESTAAAFHLAQGRWQHAIAHGH